MAAKQILILTKMHDILLSQIIDGHRFSYFRIYVKVYRIDIAVRKAKINVFQYVMTTTFFDNRVFDAILCMRIKNDFNCTSYRFLVGIFTNIRLFKQNYTYLRHKLGNLFFCNLFDLTDYCQSFDCNKQQKRPFSLGKLTNFTRKLSNFGTFFKLKVFKIS